MGQLTPGNFSFPFNLDVQVEGPLDSRLTVETVADLSSLPLQYSGMIVSVVADGDQSGPYFLHNGTWVKITTTANNVAVNETKTLTSGSVNIDSAFDGYYDGQLIIAGLGIDSLLSAELDATTFTSTTGIFNIYMLGHDGGNINLLNGILFDTIFDEIDLSNTITIGKGQYCKLWYNADEGAVNYIVHAL